MATKIPSQEMVAYRALALLALLIRTQAEKELSKNPAQRPAWSEHLQRMRKWLKDEKVERHLSRQERKWLNKPLGLWDDKDVSNHIWRTEGLTALLWALGQFKTMPGYDRMVDARSVWDKLPVLELTARFLKNVRLRGRKRLEAERHAAEFWHWRARTEQLRRFGFTPPKGDTFRACIRRAAETARQRKFVSRTVKDDVPILGKPYAKLSPKEQVDAYFVAVERHRALNWLCGYSERGDWDTTQTDT